MPLPYEQEDSKEAGQYTPIQVFSPDTISASLTVHDVTDILVVRCSADGVYYINAASSRTVSVTAGTVIGIAEGVTSITFAGAQVLELMSR